MTNLTAIAHNLSQVQTRIAQACRLNKRETSSVSLLAVSKVKPLTSILQALQAKQVHFGENYVQEGVEKIQTMRIKLLEEETYLKAAKTNEFILKAVEKSAIPEQTLGKPVWHLIGALQSNKTAAVAAYFDWVQSVDRIKIAQRLSEQRATGAQRLDAEIPQGHVLQNLSVVPLQVCVQINIDHAPSKSGALPQSAWELCEAVLKLPHLELRGIMTIPDRLDMPLDDPFHPHCQAKQLFDLLKSNIMRHYSIKQANRFDTLSMGMSEDLEAAIAHGSTMVRVGSAIFGHR